LAAVVAIPEPRDRVILSTVAERRYARYSAGLQRFTAQRPAPAQHAAGKAAGGAGLGHGKARAARL
jgi:hypothetical protein